MCVCVFCGVLKLQYDNTGSVYQCKSLKIFDSREKHCNVSLIASESGHPAGSESL